MKNTTLLDTVVLMNITMKRDMVKRMKILIWEMKKKLYKEQSRKVWEAMEAIQIRVIALTMTKMK